MCLRIEGTVGGEAGAARVSNVTKGMSVGDERAVDVAAVEKRFETSTDDSSALRYEFLACLFTADFPNVNRAALASAGDAFAACALVDEFRPRTVRVTHARVAVIDSSLGSFEFVREGASALALYLVCVGSNARGGLSVAVVELQAGFGLHATPEEVEDAFESAVAGHGDVILAREGGVADRGEARLPAQTVGIGDAHPSDAELSILSTVGHSHADARARRRKGAAKASRMAKVRARPAGRVARAEVRRAGEWVVALRPRVVSRAFLGPADVSLSPAAAQVRVEYAASPNQRRAGSNSTPANVQFATRRGSSNNDDGALDDARHARGHAHDRARPPSAPPRRRGRGGNAARASARVLRVPAAARRGAVAPPSSRG